MSVYTRRIQNIRKEIQAQNLDGIYVSNLTNVRYLSGFTGSAGIVLLFEGSGYFFSDTRYDIQSKEEVKGLEIRMIAGGYFKTIKKENILRKKQRIGFEANHLPYASYEQIRGTFPDIEWVPTKEIIEKAAAIKDAEEIQALQKAVDITDAVFEEILQEAQIGKSERTLAAKVSYLFKQHGADGDSYDPIVASGPNSALPHAKPTDRVLKQGDFLLFDIGAMYRGYHADMTRTVVVGKADEKQKEIYQIVRKAQEAGIAACRSGVPGGDVDRACRDYIASCGYKNEFCHSTGHGIGLEVHTYPVIAQSNQEPLAENYVITIEPGIYLPGFGGVRIEDDCLVLKDGCRPLNKSPKHLIEI